MTKANIHSFLIVLFIFFAINESIASVIPKFREGMASEYMAIAYSLKCNSGTQDVDFIIRYKNTSRYLIGFDVNDIFLGTTVPNVLHLEPFKKKGIFDNRGFPKVFHEKMESHFEDNDLDYFLNFSKAITLRYSVTENYIYDSNVSYKGKYTFSFLVKEKKLRWIGDFKFILDKNCFAAEKSEWHNVDEVNGIFYDESPLKDQGGTH